MAGLPEHLLRRSAEARAKAEGRDVEEVLAELKGEAPPAPEQETPAAAPEPAPAAPAPEPTPTRAAAPAPAAGPVRDLEAESTGLGVPVPLQRRAMEGRARKEGKPVPAMAGAAPAAATAAPATSAPAPAAPAAAAPAIPEGVTTQRLLTVVKAGAIQQVKSSPQDKVNVWPHLLAIEFVALMVVTAGLIVFSVFVDAPLLEFANFNEQPNP